MTRIGRMNADQAKPSEGTSKMSSNRKRMSNPSCPQCAGGMSRSVREISLTYKSESETFSMPGWYCEHCEEGVHSGQDLKVADRVMKRMKGRVDCPLGSRNDR
ncbi:YgiT-type zinc finger protein [Geomonas sp. Red276]